MAWRNEGTTDRIAMVSEGPPHGFISQVLTVALWFRRFSASGTVDLLGNWTQGSSDWNSYIRRTNLRVEHEVKSTSAGRWSVINGTPVVGQWECAVVQSAYSSADAGCWTSKWPNLRIDTGGGNLFRWMSDVPRQWYVGSRPVNPGGGTRCSIAVPTVWAGKLSNSEIYALLRGVHPLEIAPHLLDVHIPLDGSGREAVTGIALASEVSGDSGLEPDPPWLCSLRTAVAFPNLVLPGVASELIRVPSSAGTAEVVDGLVASVAFSAVPGTVTAPAGETVDGVVASVAFSAIPGTVSKGAVVVDGVVASMALSAEPGDSIKGAVVVDGEVASVAFSAVPGTTALGAVVVDGEVASVAFSAVPGSVSEGPDVVDGVVASVVLSAVPGTVVLGAETVDGVVATCSLSAIPGDTAKGAVVVDGEVASFALSAVPGTVTLGAEVVDGVVAEVALSAVPGVVTSAAPIVVDGLVASLALTAFAGDTIVGFPESVARRSARTRARRSSNHRVSRSGRTRARRR